MNLYPKDFELRTGFVHVRAEIGALAVTEGAKQRIAEATFSVDFRQIASNLALLKELKSYLLFHALSEEYFVDLSLPLLQLLQPERSLQEEDLVALRKALSALLSLQLLFGEEEDVKALHSLVSEVTVSEEVQRVIERILDRTGHIKDSASPELLQIRNQLNAKSNRVSRRMEELLVRCQRDGYADANAQVMLRDGRLVLPIAAQHKRKIPSLQLGSSSTGQTLFVAPYEILELENEITELEEREFAEIARILKEVTDACRPYAPELARCSELLLYLDTLRAKALYAIEVHAAAPILVEEARLYLREAQHPVLYRRLQREGKEPIPLNLSLEEAERIVVISGPNAGGKSVALQTVALAVYMLQCGFLPLVKENSEMGLFEDLLLDIGDAQSIENDLSTYSSHLQSMKFFTEHAGPRSLFLIDEMGAGTEPRAGGAIAQATLWTLFEKGAYGIVTTHYDGLKELATKTLGMRNASMRYDLEKLTPLYTLDFGMPGSSYAFEIARKMGLAPALIAQAEDIAGREYISLEEQLRLLEKDKRALEERELQVTYLQQEVEQLQNSLTKEQSKQRERREQIIAQARREAQALLKDCNRVIEETVRLIKESNADKETTKRVREELKFYQEFVETESKQTALKETEPPPSKQTLSVGDTVKLLDGTTKGQVVNIQGNKVVVAVGQILTSMRLEDVTPLASNEVKDKKSSKTQRGVAPVSSMRQRRLNFSPNIDIRGMRGDEAMQQVEQFLDDAQMFNIPFVSILHGKGTGILRQLLHDYLRHATFVESFTNTSPTCGDGGITEVYLKG